MKKQWKKAIICLVVIAIFCETFKIIPAWSKNKKIFSFSNQEISTICSLYEKRKFFLLSKFLQKRLNLIEKSILRENKKNYPACFLRALGTYMYYNENYIGALYFFEKVRNYELIDLVNLSAIYLKLGKLKKAEKVLEYAILQYPKNPNLLYNYAVYYVRVKRYKKAREVLLNLLNLLEVKPELKLRAYKLLNYLNAY